MATGGMKFAIWYIVSSTSLELYCIFCSPAIKAIHLWCEVNHGALCDGKNRQANSIQAKHPEVWLDNGILMALPCYLGCAWSTRLKLILWSRWPSQLDWMANAQSWKTGGTTEASKGTRFSKQNAMSWSKRSTWLEAKQRRDCRHASLVDLNGKCNQNMICWIFLRRPNFPDWWLRF